MTDYGHELVFGTFLTPGAADPGQVIALAQLTEATGLDLATFQDHPYQAQFLDTWTLLSVVAARTTTLRISPNVVNLPLRPPAVLARAAASQAQRPGGRVERGRGAGAFWEAIAAMGGRRLSPGDSVLATEEAIQVIRAIWDTDQRSVSVPGQFHQVRGVHPGPRPAHPIGIWVGAYKPRMLELTGRLADGWLPSSSYLAPEALGEANKRIDDAALAAGRAPAEVRRLYNLAGRFSSSGREFLQGPPQLWAEQLADLCVGEGVGTFILASDDPDDIRRFAAEVAPAVREMVAAHRESAALAPEDDLARAVRLAEPVEAGDLAGTDPGAQAGLRAVPTPDDGHRFSDERVWDETQRPAVAPATAGQIYGTHEQAAGQHLIDVHDHLRSELAQVRDIIDQVTSGRLSAGAARSAINDMTMRQNNWTAGTFCQSYCRVVTTHHTLEDQSMFPHLRAADPDLAPVIDRLEYEHRVIHDVLERVDQALVAFVSRPGGQAELRAAVDLLSDALLSHLSYEERELVEPLARLGYY